MTRRPTPHDGSQNIRFYPQVSVCRAKSSVMNQEQNAKIAFYAIEAASAAMDAFCKANNIDVLDLTDEQADSFLNAALTETFPPHTKMSDIWKGATDKTVGEDCCLKPVSGTAAYGRNELNRVSDAHR